MPRIVKVPYEGGDHDAIELDFDVASEPWSEYRFIDGGRVRLKTTVSKIFRLVDENQDGMFTEEGDPFVVVRHNTVISASE